MTGRAARIGGTWITTATYNSQIVQANRVYGQALGGVSDGNQIDNVITAPQLAGPWWIRYTVLVPDVAIGGGTLFGAWFGSDVINVFFGLLCTYGGTPGAETVEVLGGNVSSAELDVTVPMAAFEDHEFVLQYNGAGGFFVLLDDVNIGSRSGVTIGPTTGRQFEFYNNVTGLAGSMGFGLVEVGIGTYPI